MYAFGDEFFGLTPVISFEFSYVLVCFHCIELNH